MSSGPHEVLSKYKQPLIAAAEHFPTFDRSYIGVPNVLSADGSVLNGIKIEDKNDLSTVYAGVCNILDITLSPETIHERVEHETDHAVAAVSVRLAEPSYVLRVGNVAIDRDTTESRAQLFVDVRDLPNDPLVRAAILAYPMRPSPGDIQQLDGLGYSVERVGLEVEELHKVSDLQLPLPRSYIGRKYV